jgi:hypothetical protein
MTRSPCLSAISIARGTMRILQRQALRCRQSQRVRVSFSSVVLGLVIRAVLIAALVALSEIRLLRRLSIHAPLPILDAVIIGGLLIGIRWPNGKRSDEVGEKRRARWATRRRSLRFCGAYEGTWYSGLSPGPGRRNRPGFSLRSRGRAVSDVVSASAYRARIASFTRLSLKISSLRRDR